MTLLFSLILLGFVLKDDDLFVLRLSGYFANCLESCRVFRDLDSDFIRYKQNVEFDFIADVSVEFFEVNNVAVRNSVLLASVFDDCLH